MPDQTDQHDTPGDVTGSPTSHARCPRCSAALDLLPEDIRCGSCGRVYPRLGAIPVLLPEPERYLASCHRQLALLEEQVARTVRDILEQTGDPDVLDSTRARCASMVEALQGQLEDIRSILAPTLGRRPDVRAQEAPGRIPATLEHLPYLYRDWGWPPEEDGENERALAAVEAVLGDEPLGHTLVLGAGACRLAYDLHHRHPDAELVALELDPVLFSAAHRITAGESVTIREANLEMGDLDQGSRRWELAAPEGPVDPGRFHLLVADALDPPLAPGVFDTVLTPWFIDQGPEDVRDLFPVLDRMLRPSGRWVNLGPLRYDLDVPVARRFTREELFDLTRRAGFSVDRWRTESGPYLVSKLNGRGKVEWVLAFAAEKLERPEEVPPESGEPPDWLVFGHRPVPTFPSQSEFRSEAPAIRTVVDAIDGDRTLDDITRIVAREANQPDLTMGQIRTAVRQCLARVHPECRGER